MFDDQPRKNRTVSLTPLIDVVFLLLIFFMLASTFLQTQSLTVVTPSVDSSEAPEDPLVIEVWLLADGRMLVDGEEVAETALVDRLTGEIGGDRSRIVSVIAEKGAQTQSLVTAVEAARTAGAETVSTTRAERYAP